jgi:hypothetical protein
MKKTLALFLGLAITAISFGQSLKINTTVSKPYGKIVELRVSNEKSKAIKLEITDYLGETIFTDEFTTSYEKRFSFDLPKSVIDKGIVLIITTNGRDERYIIKP